MKISKVDHVQMAVSAARVVEGIMYDEQTKDVQELAKNAAQKAEKLYRPFSTKIRNEPDKDLANNLANNWKIVFAPLLLNADSAKNCFDDLKSNCKKKDKYYFQNYCQKYLISTLQKTKIKNGKAYKLVDTFAKYMAYRLLETEPLDDVEKKLLQDALLEDWHKEKRRKGIVASIKRNNTKVQIDEATGKLVLSGYQHKLKKHIFEFVKDYADSDPEKRRKMVKHIRSLIVLYIAGADSYGRLKQESSFDVWNWGTKITGNFDETAYKCLEEVEKLQSVKFDDYEKISEEEKKNRKKQEKCNRKEQEKCIRRAYESLMESIVQHYWDAIKEENLDAADKFWLEYFERVLENLFRDKHSQTKRTVKIKKKNISRGYLCNYLFKEWNSFIASKFVNMGKAVYNFAMPPISKLNGGVCFGKVLPQYQKGISSFDYERIKAEENLNRGMAVAATFAGTVFSNNIVSWEKRDEKKDDPLFYNKCMIKDRRRPDAKRRLLQFFGGQSCWEKSGINNENELNFILAIKQCMEAVRNYSYHYSTEKRNLRPENFNFIKDNILAQEICNARRFYLEKYYSNNVPVFYKHFQILELMKRMYRNREPIPAQIPAFYNVLPRNELDKFLNDWDKERKQKIDEMVLDGREQYKSAIYFILKDIYYNGFLSEKGNQDIKKSFLDVEECLYNRIKNCDKKQAIKFKSFDERIQEIKDRSFSEICQQLQTDVNMQNQRQKIVKSGIQKDKDKTSGHKALYQHYLMLLYKVLRETFLQYLKEDKVYQFLLTPEYNKTDDDIESFCSKNIDAFAEQDKFSHLPELANKNHFALAWFISAHFLPARQLNRLRGELKGYIQFIKNIDKRAECTKNYLDREDTERRASECEEILEMLELASLTVGRISNNIQDYFSKTAGKTVEEQYREYLGNFFNFDVLDGPKNSFFDGQHAIMNRGIAFSVMFGMEHIMEKIKDKITREEYEAYTAQINDNKLTKIKCSGANNWDEQEELLKFNQLKKRVELQDILVYSELIADCLSQLVVFSYLWERDKLYYQLGFHYLRLFYGTGEVKAEEKELKGEYCKYRKDGKARKVSIDIADGALLYQLLAIYTASCGHVFIKDSNGGIKKETYKKELLKKYYDGMEFFVRADNKPLNVQQSSFKAMTKKKIEKLTSIRNNIDHMKYLALRGGMSLLGYFSAIFNNFFNYDLKLKNSVGYILRNIFKQYNVDLYINYNLDEDFETKQRIGEIGIITDRTASTEFKYKKLQKKHGVKKMSYTFPVHSECFIKEIINLLQKELMPVNINNNTVAK